MEKVFNEWRIDLVVNRDLTNNYQWKGSIYDTSLSGIYSQLRTIDEILKEENHNYVFHFKKRNQATRKWRRQYIKSVKFHEKDKIKTLYKKKRDYIAKVILFGNNLHSNWSTWISGIGEDDLSLEIDKFEQLAKSRNWNYVYFVYKRSDTKGKWIPYDERTVIHNTYQNIEDDEKNIKIIQIGDGGEILKEIEMDKNGEVVNGSEINYQTI